MGVFRNWRRPASIRREAIAWIYRLAQPDVTEDEKARCQAWLDSSPDNPREFLLATALLDLQSRGRGLPMRPARLRAYAAGAVAVAALLAAVMFWPAPAPSYSTGI